MPGMMLESHMQQMMHEIENASGNEFDVMHGDDADA